MGGANSYLIACDGGVWAWGKNNCGQLGLGHENPINRPTKIPNLINIVDIVCSNNTTHFLDKNGHVWCKIPGGL